MENSEEVKRWVSNAEEFFENAKVIFPLKRFQVVIQNAQLCIEHCAKSIISCFSSVEWEHDPGAQLLKILEQQKESIEKKVGKETFLEMKLLVEYSHNTSNWHNWSVYGKMDLITNKWVFPRELCTEEVAGEILPIAEKSLSIVKKFIQSWFK